MRFPHCSDMEGLVQCNDFPFSPTISSIMHIYEFMFTFFFVYYDQVKGVAEKLKSSPEKGIHGDETDLLERKNIFGSNTYPRKKGRSFWVCYCKSLSYWTICMMSCASLTCLFLSCVVEISLGSLSRHYFNHLDGSCGCFFGPWDKDRGKLNFWICSNYLFFFLQKF